MLFLSERPKWHHLGQIDPLSLSESCISTHYYQQIDLLSQQFPKSVVHCYIVVGMGVGTSLNCAVDFFLTAAPVDFERMINVVVLEEVHNSRCLKLSLIQNVNIHHLPYKQMKKQYVFVERSVTVSVNFFSKPLYTQKEKLNLKYILQYPTEQIQDLSTEKTKKIIERKSNSPKV